MSHSLIGFVQSGEVFVFLSRNYAHSTDGIFSAKIVTLGHGEFFFLEYIIFGWEDYYLSSCNYHHTRQLIHLFILSGEGNHSGLIRSAFFAQFPTVDTLFIYSGRGRY